ncbi:MAG: CRTAC1 family protein [Candidatus Binatia bacterium]
MVSSSSSAGQESTLFVEIAREAGIDFTHFNGMTGSLALPEIIGVGGALFDYDNDGDLDVFVVQGGLLDPRKKLTGALFPWKEAQPPIGRLYRNDITLSPDGSRQVRFSDVTEQSRISAVGYGMGVAAGDVNNDGWVDLYITNLGRNQLWRNNGDGTFSDASTSMPEVAASWSTSAAFFDYDRDGWLDLYVTNYVQIVLDKQPTCYAKSSAPDYCGPDAFPPATDRLFHNRGDGAFEDVSETSGIRNETWAGLGVITADFNGDGWSDVYVANDGDPNLLWINQKNGAFKNEALWAGCAVNRLGVAEGSMGVDAGDFDGDGDEDLFMTHLMEETHTLYVNLGEGLFEDRTIQVGLTTQRRYTGFGAAWFDYDNDGWLDFFILNGAVKILPERARQGDRYPLGQPNQLFHNEEGRRFVETSTQAGATFALAEVSRGAAFGDIDNDGDTDVLVLNNNGPARLLLNQVGHRQHWLGLRLVGAKEKRDMLGAKVEVVRRKKNALWRRVRTDGSYLSSNDPRVLVGLGTDDKIDAVRVHWPNGQQETWSGLRLDRYVTLQQGTAPRP